MVSTTVVALLVVAVAAIAFLATRGRPWRARRDTSPPAGADHRDPGNTYSETLPAAATAAGGRVPWQPLLPDDAIRFVLAWRRIQGQSAEDPGSALVQADRLLGEVMNARGYPLGTSDPRSADLWKEQPLVASAYHGARAAALRHARGQAGADDFRRAYSLHVTLFDHLLAAHPADGDRRPRTPGRPPRIATGRS